MHVDLSFHFPPDLLQLLIDTIPLLCRSKLDVLLILTVVFAGVCWAFPPIHFHSLKAARQSRADAQFDAKDFVATFWDKTLLPATANAADAAKVVDAITRNPEKVRERFGRTVGVNSSYFLFLRGSARVVTAETDSIGLSVKPDGSEPDIAVPIDFVFGNAVRDATGLLDSSKYPNAQEFNDISAQLNDVVEKRVLPEFQRVAKVGRRVEFSGCVEVSDETTGLKPLKLVPIVVKGE
jgi:predicted lipoprotein